MKVKKIPQRRCVGCREMKDKISLQRIAVNTCNEIVLDNKSPGRGAYICQNVDCLQKAQKSKGLERSLKRDIPANIYEQVALLIGR